MVEATRSSSHELIRVYACHAQETKMHGILGVGRSTTHYGLPSHEKSYPAQERRSTRNSVHALHVARRDSWGSSHHSGLCGMMRQTDCPSYPLNSGGRRPAGTPSWNEMQTQTETEDRPLDLLQERMSCGKSDRRNIGTWTPTKLGLWESVLPMSLQTEPLLAMERFHFLKTLEASEIRRHQR